MLQKNGDIADAYIIIPRLVGRFAEDNSALLRPKSNAVNFRASCTYSNKNFPHPSSCLLVLSVNMQRFVYSFDDLAIDISY
jgi:hypothetical protein